MDLGRRERIAEIERLKREVAELRERLAELEGDVIDLREPDPDAANTREVEAVEAHQAS